METWAFDQWFNAAEALLWIGISLVILFRDRRSFHRMPGLAAACAFFLFGLSDLIEIQTRAWFRPWPLLALKAGCAVVLLLAFRSFLKNNRLP